MANQIDNGNSTMVASECSTEIASAQIEEDQKTEEDRATIIRNKEKRTLLYLFGACLHGRFQERDYSRSFRNYNLLRKSLWIVTAVFLTVFTVYQASNLALYMLQQKAIVHTQITTEKTVLFPAVTICSQEPFQKKKLELYRHQAATTPSTNTINDFDAVWEIYELEEALKLHAKQPSCVDNLSNIQCVLKPANCSKKEDSNFKTTVPDYQNIRRKRNLEYSTLYNFDLRLSSPWFYDSPRSITEPRSISNSLTSRMLKSSHLNFLDFLTADSLDMLDNVCAEYYVYVNPESQYFRECYNDPDCLDNFSLYTFLDLTWLKEYFGTTLTFKGDTMINWGSVNPSEFLWAYYGSPASKEQYPSLWWLFVFFPKDYSEPNSEMSYFLGLLYSYFPGQTYEEIMAYMNAVFSSFRRSKTVTLDMLDDYYEDDKHYIMDRWHVLGYDIDHEANSIPYTLEAIYGHFTYYEILDDLFSNIYSAGPIDPRGDRLGKTTLDALYIYLPGYTYEELVEIWFSHYPDSESLSHAQSYSSMIAGLQELYALYPGYSLTAIVDHLLAEACAVSEDSAYLEYASKDGSEDDFTTLAIGDLESQVLHESNALHTTWTTGDPENQVLAEGNALDQESEEEIDMLGMLVFGSPFADPLDLMQWSSISTRQIEEFGFTYSELISDCTYNGDTCDQRDFTKWNNDRYGNCFTFNSEFNSETKPRKANQPGKQNGLKLVLNTMKERPSGYRLSIHHPTEVPMPEENGIDVSAERTSVLSTSAQLRERLLERQGTCKEIDLELDGSQTLDGCKKVCQEEMIRLNCKCKKVMLQMKEDIEEQLPECSSRNMECLRTVTEQYDKDSCSHCFAPCQEFTYKTAISAIERSQINDGCLNDLTITPNQYQKTILSVIHVHFENLHIEKLTETLSYPLHDLVTEIGIWIYFVVGLSMLGLLEFVFELLIMLASKRNNPIKNVDEEKTVTIKYESKGVSKSLAT